MEKNVTHDNESEKLEHEQEPRSLRTRLLHLMGVMTIEPMLFFQFLGLCLKSVAESQMILYKTCRGKILNMTLASFGQEICNISQCRGEIQLVCQLLLTH